MWRVIGWAILILLSLAVGYLLHVIQVEGMHIRLLNSPDVQISYLDMVTVTLTALAIIIALVSIALAVAALVGWNSIESKATRTAMEVTSDHLNDEKSALHRVIRNAIADENSPLHKTLREEAQRAMFAGVGVVRDAPAQGGQQ